jgi:hypothetical protein
MESIPSLLTYREPHNTVQYSIHSTHKKAARFDLKPVMEQAIQLFKRIFLVKSKMFFYVFVDLVCKLLKAIVYLMYMLKLCIVQV